MSSLICWQFNGVRVFHFFPRFAQRARAACLAICWRRFALSFFLRALPRFAPSLPRSAGKISITSPFGRLGGSSLGLPTLAANFYLAGPPACWTATVALATRAGYFGVELAE
jgi:hypothetical protein